ncbi:MAG: glycine zipper domain-containing protein [Desulfobacteraceae bacterium]|nr:glycine zipper domain-containing protein [Desulfobacteraceae bacterium]
MRWDEPDRTADLERRRHRYRSGAIIGAIAGSAGLGAAIGGVVGAGGGYLYGKHKESEQSAYQQGYNAGRQNQ